MVENSGNVFQINGTTLQMLAGKSFDPLRINPETGAISYDGAEVALTPRQAGILAAFCIIGDKARRIQTPDNVRTELGEINALFAAATGGSYEPIKRNTIIVLFYDPGLGRATGRGAEACYFCPPPPMPGLS